MKNLFFSLLCLLMPMLLSAQAPPSPSFRTFRLVSGFTPETIWQGNLMFNVSHRFGGTINEGFGELFGMDALANTRLGFGYGVTDNITVGLGRTSGSKVYDLFAKYRFVRQEDEGQPFSATVVGSAAVRSTEFDAVEAGELNFSHRLSYTGQVIVGSRLAKWISVQLAPTIVHRNIANTLEDDNTTLWLGAGAQFNLSNTFGIAAEYYPPLGDYTFGGEDLTGTFGLSFDFATVRHEFQFQFTNNTDIVSQEFLPRTTGSFFEGQNIHIGFHITRKFGL